MTFWDYAVPCIGAATAVACLVGIVVIKCTGWRWDVSHPGDVRRPGASASPALLAAPPDPTLFALYKQILSSVLPPDMLTDNGLLKTPDGKGEGIRFIHKGSEPNERSRWYWWDFVLGAPHTAASYSGGLNYNFLMKNLKAASGGRPATWQASLIEQAEKYYDGYGTTDVIDLSNARALSSLAHEAFHDIQNYLLTYHPRVYTALLQQSLRHESQIRAWYTAPETTSLRGYELEIVYAKSFDSESAALFMETFRVKNLAAASGKPIDVTAPDIQALIQRNAVEKYRLEIIPMLMGAAAECDQRAIAILGGIFTASGLNPHFVDVWPWREKPISTAAGGDEAETREHADG